MIGKLKDILQYHRDRNLPLIWHPKVGKNVRFKRCYGSWEFTQNEYEWCISKAGVEMWEINKAPSCVKSYKVT